MHRLKNSPFVLRTVPVYLLFNIAVAIIAIITTSAGLAVARTNARAQGFRLRNSAVTVASQTGSPSDAVREFYRLMRERKFREAFAISIYQPAIEGLKQAEFDDLRPDFERLASAIPEKVNITGEQISGETATVFVKVKDEDNKEQAEPVTLIRINGKWIVGDRENQEVVKKAGSEFFFNARIDTHHNEVKDLMQRIALAQVVFSQQHAGKFGDMPSLILAGLIPKDLEGTESTGYRFRVTISSDGKSWSANAEPAQYGRSGRLSFRVDQSGVKSADMAGKPLLATPLKD